jgi:flagellar basal body-associated protein FliL
MDCAFKKKTMMIMLLLPLLMLMIMIAMTIMMTLVTFASQLTFHHPK